MIKRKNRKWKKFDKILFRKINKLKFTPSKTFLSNVLEKIFKKIS